MAELDEIETEGLAAQVQTREDLRELVYDMQRLPDDQRAALVLAELDALSHTEISEALGVPREKVKALVFQARESLVASRNARETACQDIRAQIANGRGAVLRRGDLRRHLRECDGCREFRAQVDRQRRQFALLLPVAPTIALKEIVLGGTVGGGMLGGGLLAPSALKSAVAKGVVGAMLAGAGTAGTVVVAASDLHLGGIGFARASGARSSVAMMERSAAAGARAQPTRSRGLRPASRHRAHAQSSRRRRVASRRSATPRRLRRATVARAVRGHDARTDIDRRRRAVAGPTDSRR